ncbi:MAG: hypothetical protein IJA63_11365 [Akkermansia sp.]|nr:hypothetical protein [Akkermansia sp.]
MTYYIVHFASINTDGELSIDCLPAFRTRYEAECALASLIDEYPLQHSYPTETWYTERHGCFVRIANCGSQAEMQCHVQEVEVG